MLTGHQIRKVAFVESACDTGSFFILCNQYGYWPLQLTRLKDGQDQIAYKSFDALRYSDAIEPAVARLKALEGIQTALVVNDPLSSTDEETKTIDGIQIIFASDKLIQQRYIEIMLNEAKEKKP